ncbi:MAG: DEAD/DEAH box helicase family protein [Candidatus Thorarchaeota archaeon]|jgi:superfamily II DNA or RNA helicase
MKSFPDDMKFRFKWRPYQARVLSELESHMGDERLHVVAAPASGKTVLGIEVARRINGPTLVLAPTLAIRDQWVQRLEELFLPAGSTTPDWISYDLTRPGFFTVATYQLLHSVMKKIESQLDTSQEPEEPEEEDISQEEDRVLSIVYDFDDIDTEDTDDDLDEEEEEERRAFDWLNQKKTNYRNAPIPKLSKTLMQMGIKTVVLDEAHHLRSSWWKSLTDLIRDLDDIRVLALTATPPYDVPPAEWDRYMNLCGPVDAEISVPELVRVQNLCPHQDLVVFSSPSHEEEEVIRRFRLDVENLQRNLESNESFHNLLNFHRWIMDPESHVEEILEAPDFFTSILVYLNHIGTTLPPDALALIADTVLEIPEFDLEWLEVLLTGIFYPRSGKRPKFEPEIEVIRDELRSIKAIERRKVILRNALFIEKILKRSISKMDSIVDIANIEYGSYGSDLRMVVLSDYIRKDYLPSNSSHRPELDKIGVVPIFEALRRAKLNGAKLGVLTGSIIIISRESEELFRKYALDRGITGNDMELDPLPGDDAYLLVKVLSHDKHKMVRVVTDFFTDGGANVLVGTKSLLGEGWDAPSINSLVISSVVGSFMLSNQMRGRAIRIQSGNPTKTANIWHLVCIEPNSLNPGPDYRTMIRRFRAFVGVSEPDMVIENGFGRLKTGEPPFSVDELREINEDMFQKSMKRSGMSLRWELAIGDQSDDFRLTEDAMFSEVQLPMRSVKSLTRSSAFLVSFILLIFGAFVVITLPLSIAQPIFIFFLLYLFMMCWCPTRSIFSQFYRFLVFSSPKRALRRVGNALLHALWHSGELSGHWSEYALQVDESPSGLLYCHLKNGNRREKSLFLQSIQEVLNPIVEPRYLLSLKSDSFLEGQRIDYYAVPKVLGTRKEHSSEFSGLWGHYVYPMKLVFTRNAKGRLELLKARTKTRVTLKGSTSTMITRWK